MRTPTSTEPPEIIVEIEGDVLPMVPLEDVTEDLVAKMKPDVGHENDWDNF